MFIDARLELVRQVSRILDLEDLLQLPNVTKRVHMIRFSHFLRSWNHPLTICPPSLSLLLSSRVAGMSSAMEIIKTLALNMKLIRNEETLVESLTSATTAFAAEAIDFKVVAVEIARAAADSSATVMSIVVPLDTIAADATNAVAGCDEQLVAKASMESVLKRVAGGLASAVAENSDDATHIKTGITKIATSVGESAGALYTNRDDVATPAGAMTPAMDEVVLDSLSQIATTKLAKAEVTATSSSVVGKVTGYTEETFVGVYTDF